LLLKGQGPTQLQYNDLALYYELRELDNKNGTKLTDKIIDEKGALRKLNADEQKALDLWFVDTSGKTLGDDYKINSKTTDPIYMEINGNTINITANLRVYGDGAEILSDGWAYYYRELVVKGIEESWSGDYWINGRWVTVNATAFDYNNGSYIYQRNQKFMNVEIINEFERSHGGLKNPYFWNSGRSITLYLGMNSSTYSDNDFKGIVCHEFGHTLGMDDAYNVTGYGMWDRKEAPESDVSTNDIMRKYTGKTSVLDVSMALNAFKTKKIQYFPGK